MERKLETKRLDRKSDSQQTISRSKMMKRRSIIVLLLFAFFCNESINRVTGKCNRQEKVSGYTTKTTTRELASFPDGSECH